MFDIWLTESTNLVKEIIEKSNLRDVTEAVVKDFMTTEKFKKLIEEQVEIQVKSAIEEYSEYYILSDKGFEEMVVK
jgi:hypothetical protein